MTGFGGWQIDLSSPLLNLLAALLLLSFLLSLRAAYRRLFHRSSLRSLIVMVLNGFAYLAVLCLLLEPRFTSPADRAVTLITRGANLDEITQKNTAHLYLAPGAVASPDAHQYLKDANWLLDMGQLKLREPALAILNVRGFGLDQNQWQNLPDDLDVVFEPPAVSGFTAIRFPRFLVEGGTLRIDGRFQQAGSGGIFQLRLLDPAANIVAETRLKNGQAFKLATLVKSHGNLEYTLQAWQTDTRLSEQLIPVNVGSSPALNMMIEQSAPSFETRSLKNYAASKGHRVRLNTDISKDRKIRQSANLAAGAATSFSPQTLSEQDILIMDGRAFSQLPEARARWLTDSVRKGLGLLIIADSSLLEPLNKPQQGLLSGFRLTSHDEAVNVVNPRLNSGDNTTWQQPVEITALQLDADDAEVLIDTAQGRKLVVRRTKGLGNVSVSLIAHSHSWMNAGYQAQWGNYWTSLLAAIARPRNGSYLLKPVDTGFNRVNERTAICALITEKDTGAVISVTDPTRSTAGFEQALAIDTLASPRQCTYFWPQAGGWHQLQLRSGNGESTLDEKAIYVFNEEQWPGQRHEQRVQATRSKSFNNQARPAEASMTWVSEPVNVLWFWLMLVMSASILWLERKLDMVTGQT